MLFAYIVTVSNDAAYISFHFLFFFFFVSLFVSDGKTDRFHSEF